MKKIYLVTGDTHNTHNAVGEFVTIHGEAKDKFFWVKSKADGVLFLCKGKDLKDVTGEYYTKKAEMFGIFFAGITALIITASNAFNGGNWIGTIAFAIIGFACFTVYKIQKDEY